MEYTIKKVAELSGVSTRTLRYYDEIDLLKPARINSSGYRIYGTKEIDMLQQILFYRSLDMKLENIQHIIQQPEFNSQQALIKHHQQLMEKRQQIDHLILTIEKTLRYQKGEIIMTDKEKFEGFKQKKLEENEQLYGKEIREKYGEQEVADSNKQWMNLTEEQFRAMEKTEQELFDALKQVVESQDFESPEAETAYLKHREWLGFTSDSYSPEKHIGIAQLYTADERFASYYDDRVGKNAAATLTEIIKLYAKK